MACSFRPVFGDEGFFYCQKSGAAVCSERGAVWIIRIMKI